MDYAKRIETVSVKFSYLVDAVDNFLKEAPPSKAVELKGLFSSMKSSTLSECVNKAKGLCEKVPHKVRQGKVRGFIDAYEALKNLQDDMYGRIIRRIDNVTPNNLKNISLLENINRHIRMNLAYKCRLSGKESDLYNATRAAIGNFLKQNIEVKLDDRGQFALVFGKAKLTLNIHKEAECAPQVYINHFGPANN